MKADLSIEVLISAYSQGYFPMAEPSEGELYWHSPDPRAIFPIDNLKISRSIRTMLKKQEFEFTVNKDFGRVINECASRRETWISDEIIDAYIRLHRAGFAHSIEAYTDGQLCGGLYGVAIRGAFFGESMFSTVSNASKAAFYFLYKRLKDKKFLLLDSQYLNDHTALLGAVEIPKFEYLIMLSKALKANTFFA